MKKKLGNLILDFLVKKKVKYVFILNGGAIAFLIDSFKHRKDISYVCVNHGSSFSPEILNAEVVIKEDNYIYKYTVLTGYILALLFNLVLFYLSFIKKYNLKLNSNY